MSRMGASLTVAAKCEASSEKNCRS